MLIPLKHANEARGGRGAAGPSLPGLRFPPLFTHAAPVNSDTRKRGREKEAEEDDENEAKTKRNKQHKRRCACSQFYEQLIFRYRRRTFD